MIGHGLSLQLTAVPYSVVPGVSQGTGLRKFLMVTLPVVIVPPEVSPALSIGAPVGTLPGPNALLKATNDCQLTVSYIRPPPPRSTVRPFPATSQANPPRGPKFLWSGLFRLLI